MNTKSKQNGAFFIPVLLISVVPMLILGIALAIKGDFLRDGFVTAVKALCALVALLLLARACYGEIEVPESAWMPYMASRALGYAAVFAVIYGLVSATTVILPRFTTNYAWRALPNLIGGVLQAVLLPAFIFRLLVPAANKRVGFFRYLLSFLLCLLGGALLQTEEIHGVLFSDTLVYTTVAAAYAIKLVEALLAGLCLIGTVKLLKKQGATTDFTNKKNSLIPGLIAAGIAAAVLVVSGLCCKYSSYQRILDDVDGLVAEGTEELSAGVIDMAEFSFRKADNHRNQWLLLLNDDYSARYYNDYDKDMGMLGIYATGTDNTDQAERALRAFYLDRTANASLFYLYAKNRDEDSEDMGRYYTDVLAYMAANRIYTRTFPLVEDLSEKQTAALREHLESLDRIAPLREFLGFVQEYGRTGKWRSYGYATDIAEEYPDDFFIQYYTAAYITGTVGDDDGAREAAAKYIARYLELGKAQLDKDGIEMITNQAAMQYITVGRYEEALALLKNIVPASAEESEAISLAMLNCYDRLGYGEECTALAVQLISQGSENPRILFYAGVGAVKSGKREDALDYLAKLCDLIKPDMTADETYEIEQHIVILAQYIALRDDPGWTDFEYAFYGELDETRLSSYAQKNRMAANYLEAIYHVYDAEDKEAAMKALNALTDYNGNLALAWYLKGSYLQAHGEYAEAAKMLEKSLSIHDGTAVVMYTLANSYDALGRLEEAYQLTVRVYEQFSTVNHEKDWYGLGFHNTNLMHSLEKALEEQKGGTEQ